MNSSSKFRSAQQRKFVKCACIGYIFYLTKTPTSTDMFKSFDDVFSTLKIKNKRKQRVGIG